MKKYVFLVFLVFGLFFSFRQATALTISPAKIILSANPGETIETEMRVGNDLDQTATFYPVFEGYTVRDGEEPVFYPKDFGLPIWIETLPSQLIAGPKETKSVTIKIKVPKDAPPGGHYAVIFWSTAPPKQKGGSGVGIITRVGALVFLEVSGDIAEEGEIVDFKSTKKIIRNLPIGFGYAFQNKGNVHLRPEGEVIIKNIWGKTKAVLQANPAGAIVLPQTTRVVFAENWELKKKKAELKGEFSQEDEQGFFAGLRKEFSGFGFGYYKANLYVKYGKEKNLVKAKFGFWILPWQILTLVILILAAIILFITKGIKVYNRWVIEQARKRR